MGVPVIQIERGGLGPVTVDASTGGGLIFDRSGVLYSIRVDEEDFGPTASLEVELLGGRRVRFAKGEGPFDPRQSIGAFPRRHNPTVLQLTWRPERQSEPTVAEIPCGASALEGPPAVISLGRTTVREPASED